MRKAVKAVSEGIIVAIISGTIALVGSVISFIGNMVSNSKLKALMLYRLDELEKKQDKHNGLIERMVVVEQSTRSAHKRLDKTESKR